MKYWVTEIKAICAQEGIMKAFCGPNIQALSLEEAHHYCQTNGLGYCHVIGELVSEIPCDENYNPDFTKEVDYTKTQLN